MEKEIRLFDLDYELDWEGLTEISKFKEDLDAIEKLGATHISISHIVSYDEVYIIIEAKVKRLETDEEYMEKLKEWESISAELEKQERQKLKELKEKYEK